MTQDRTTRMTTTSRINVLQNEASTQDPTTMDNNEVTTTALPAFSSFTTKCQDPDQHPHDYDTQLRNRIQGFLVPTYDWLNDGVPTNTTRDEDEQSGNHNRTNNRNSEGTLLQQAYAILTSSSDRIQAPNPSSVVVPQQQQQISAEDDEVESDNDDDEVDVGDEDEITIEPIKFDNYVNKQQTRNYHQHHDEDYGNAKNGRPRSSPRRRRSRRRRARTTTPAATDNANVFHNPYTAGSVEYYHRKELLLDDASGLILEDRMDRMIFNDVITEIENTKTATTNEAKAA